MSESKHQVVEASVAREQELAKNKRKSPAQVILDSLEGNFKTFREVAELMGVHTETLRRLCRTTNRDGTQKVNAPSKAVRSGEMTIYLFTEEDVAEVTRYFEQKGYVVNT